MVFGKVTLGLSETVIHRDRLLDPVYVLPFSGFYANQFAERGDDNVLWTIDMKYPVAFALSVYVPGWTLKENLPPESVRPEYEGFCIVSTTAL